jgi:hypothetical protein
MANFAHHDGRRAPAASAGDRGHRAVRLALPTVALAILLAGAVAACSGNPSPAPSTAASPLENQASAAPQSPAASQASASASQALAAGSSAPVDACKLMTPLEVSEIVGGPKPVAKPLPAGGWVASQCAWTSPSSSFLVSVGTSASLAGFHDPAVPDAKAKVADFKRKLVTADATDVADIGDGAVLGSTGLAASTGGTYVEILRLSLTDDQLVQIAKRIMEHL